MESIHEIARQYPETEEATVCNKTAFKARGKSFLFLGVKDDAWNVRLKLGDSISEAEQLAKKHPGRYDVGLHGWVLATFDDGESPPKGLMERWIDESFRLLAPKPLVKTLVEEPPKKATGKKTAKKKAAKKTAKRSAAKKKSPGRKAAGKKPARKTARR